MKHAAKIDIFQFCRTGRQTEGALPVADLSRLADLLVETEGDVRWSLDGRTRARAGAEPDCLLTLRVAARLKLPCSRCLQPVEVVLDSARDYLAVRSEQEAVQRDDPESDIDVVVGGRQFDLREWIEDELILALPPVGFHEKCEGSRLLRGDPPEAGMDSRAPSSDRRRPFEVLSRLKRSDLE